MQFTHDTEEALASTVALVNTLSGDDDRLTTQADVDSFLAVYPSTGPVTHTDRELRSLRALRTQLRELWTVGDRDAGAEIVNAILRDADARPFLSKHDGYDWHLHVTTTQAPVAQRIAGESAMAVLDLIREDEFDRLQICSADDCDDVYVDLSRNRSRRYCDGTCGNKANVMAYRARQKSS